MKRFTIVGLSILCLSVAATTSVNAGTRTNRISPSAETSTAMISSGSVNTKLTPFALVSFAYQGEYRAQGIPGFASFQSAIASKTITAKDLVKAAIDAQQLSPDTLTNRAFLNAVDLQLSIVRN